MSAKVYGEEAAEEFFGQRRSHKPKPTAKNFVCEENPIPLRHTTASDTD